MPTVHAHPDRRTVILETAAELFARQGINGTTVRDIADKVGMLSGSLYHHFPSKDAMVEAILGEYVDDIVERYAAVVAEVAEPRQRLDRLIHVSIETAFAHPHATEIYQANAPQLAQSGSAALKAGARSIQQTWLSTIKDGVAAGVLRDDVEPNVFYRMLRDALWLSVRWYRPRRGGSSVEKLADDCTAIFLEGFTRRP